MSNEKSFYLLEKLFSICSWIGRCSTTGVYWARRDSPGSHPPNRGRATSNLLWNLDPVFYNLRLNNQIQFEEHNVNFVVFYTSLSHAY